MEKCWRGHGPFRRSAPAPGGKSGLGVHWLLKKLTFATDRQSDAATGRICENKNMSEGEIKGQLEEETRTEGRAEWESVAANES